MTLYSWLWIGWLALFGLIEGKALANKQRGDTLSEHVWRWFAVSGGKYGRLRRFGLVVLMVWLLVHFVTGGWI